MLTGVAVNCTLLAFAFAMDGPRLTRLSSDPTVTHGLITMLQLVLGFVLVLLLTSSARRAFAQDENCTGHPSSISNGLCDAVNNNVQCGYDGGDCCRCTCADSSDYTCGEASFDCRDPEQDHDVDGCLEVPVVATLCPPDVPLDWVVNDTASAFTLAETVLCSGGVFQVEWKGNVVVNQTIYVANKTVIHVNGTDSEAGMDGRGLRRLFTVVDASLHVSNMSLSHGGAMVGGAIAMSRSSLILDRTSFASNVADYDGGALYAADGSTVLLDGPTAFVSNEAGFRGGALYIGVDSSALWTAEVSFVSNTAGVDGGAMFISSGSGASWEVEALFTNNTAGKNGGALGVYGRSAVYWQAEAHFTKNMAIDDGGALHVGQESIAFWGGGAIWVDNTAGSNGGAISLIQHSSIFWDGQTSFINNSAINDGGAMYVQHDSSVSWDAEASFISNAAGNSGGAVYAYNASEVSWQAESLFMNNTAGEDGGALVFDFESHASWKAETSFSLNTAGANAGALYIRDNSNVSWEAQTYFSNNTGGRFGGCTYIVLHSRISWMNQTVFMNNAGEHGGALYVRDDSGAFWVGDTSFINNSAAVFGGAVYAAFSSSVSWNAETSFVGNFADGDGGALHIRQESILSWDAPTSFVDNKATWLGGAVSIFVSSSVSWEGRTFFDNNTAIANGGALHLKENCNAYWDGETSFVNNNAGNNGGAVFLKEDSVASWDADTVFIDNTAGAGNGGAVYVVVYSSISWRGNTSFVRNAASGGGGAVWVFNGNGAPRDSSLVINGTTVFLGNGCAGSGGALAVAGASSMIFGTEDVAFTGNSAGAAGGAVSITGLGVGPQFVGVPFTSNIAQIGGAAYITGSGTAISEDDKGDPLRNPTTFTRCEFVDNVAWATGGGIDSGAGVDYIESSLFVGNSARAGGALKLAGTASLQGCTFIENMSLENEGPVVSNVGFVSAIGSSSFSDNALDCRGGKFLDFFQASTPDEALDVLCKGCDSQCEDCSTPDEVPQCTEEMEHTRSPGGNTTLEMLVIDRGYWRVANTSRKVLECYNADACLGGITGTPGYCQKGYEGPYCSVCSEGYSAGRGHSCKKCSGTVTDVVVAILASTLTLFTLVAFLNYMLTRNPERSGQRLAVTWKRRLLSFKVIIITWQILTQFSSVANVKYPGIYQTFLDGVDILNFDLGWILSIGCVVHLDFHDRLVIFTVGPIVALVILRATYAIVFHRMRGLDRITTGATLIDLDSTYLSSVLLLTFLVYSSVSSVLFQAFACDPLDDGTNFLRADYRIDCDSPKHRAVQVYASCMIVLYTAGIPMFYALLLFWYSHVLMDVSARESLPMAKSLSNLWELYKPSYFYYELIECGRRVLLAGVVVFVFPNTTAQIAIVLMLAMVFMTVSEALRPYESLWDVWVSRLAHVIVFSSMYLALLLKVNVSNEGTSSEEIYEVLLIFGHVVMLLVAVVEAVMLTAYCVFGNVMKGGSK